jgi:internalin A
MSDLNVIKKLDKILNIELKSLDALDLDSLGYTFDAQDKLINLSLYSCDIDNKKLGQIVSNLKELKSLAKLYLFKNHISDISTLKELTSLEKLNLSDNQISDISPLKNLISLTGLSLSNNQIIDISPLKDLSSLRELQLASNEIIDISPLRDLNCLTELQLVGNKIIDIFPLRELNYLILLLLSDNQIIDISSIKDLKSLIELHLSYNQIIDIYPLKELNRLTILDVSTNLVRDISPLKELKSLTKLWLSNNQISDISSLKELKSLTELHLPVNQIGDISSLKELKSLTKLGLSQNNISDISPLKDLTSLMLLDFSENQIVDISPLKKLRNITDLHLSFNLINDISSLKELLGLTKLILYENKVSDISPLKELESLTCLDLRHNPIINLPSWITELNMDIIWSDESLSDFILFYNNPLKNPPIEMVKQGKAALKIYFESLDIEEVSYETKLVIVGRGFAGKTVLAKKLLDITFQLPENEKTTKGVVVIKEPVSLFIEEYGVDFKYNIWDFGGQEKYDATHQLFLTENSLYLFVTEARQESNHLDFDFWLNTIELFAHNAPVIVVMSKIDERIKDIPQCTYKDRYKNIFDFAKVSCVNGMENTILSLKKTIIEATKERLKMIRFPSKAWKNVPSMLDQLSKKEDYISYNQYLKICDEFGIDHVKAKVLSKYLHDLGIIIHRDDDLLLSNIVIINIDWCVDGVYRVLDNPKVLEQKGFFSEDDLKHIWHEEKYQNKQQELLNLMKRYKLCFELRDKTGYIAPNLLPEDKPKDLSWDYSENLFFEYRYTFMPAGLLSRFIVETHAIIKDTNYWKRGVLLEYEETIALIVEDYIGRKINIAIDGQHKTGLLNTIRIFFNEVHKDIKALVPIEMIPCNCSKCQYSTTPYYFKYSVLENFLKNGRHEIPCEESTKDVSVKQLLGFYEKITNEEIIKNTLKKYGIRSDLLKEGGTYEK